MIIVRPPLGLNAGAGLPHYLDDARLDTSALGLLVYLLSRPHGASVTVQEIAGRFACGVERIRSALNRLTAVGYIERPSRVGREQDGSFGPGSLIVREQVQR